MQGGLLVRIVVCRCLALAAVAALLVVAGAVAAQDAVIRPGDVLSISVLGEDALSKQVPVSEDGMVALPLVGSVKAQGETAASMAQRLTEALAKYIKNPQVSVEIAERAPLKVVVSGSVKTPGLYSIPCDSRLSEALAAGGGPAPDADLSRVAVLSAGAAPRTLDYMRFLNQGDETQNPVLAPDDHVMVPQRPPEPENACRIVGQVARPGSYELTGAVTPWDLIAKAGGLLPGANPREALLKSAEGQPQTLDLTVFLQPQSIANAPVLRPGDTLVIPALTAQVYVLGGVRTPGPYYVTSGAKVLDAIALAGGVTEAAQLDKAYLLRASANPAKQATRQPVDLRKLLVDGDLALNVEVKGGDTLFIPMRGPSGRSTWDRVTPLLAPLLYLLF
jgi:protein involved in polysaccharide export with SLBB domain